VVTRVADVVGTVPCAPPSADGKDGPLELAIALPWGPLGR
jgi:hypothetical protein